MIINMCKYAKNCVNANPEYFYSAVSCKYARPTNFPHRPWNLYKISGLARNFEGHKHINIIPLAMSFVYFVYWWEFTILPISWPSGHEWGARTLCVIYWYLGSTDECANVHDQMFSCWVGWSDDQGEVKESEPTHTQTWLAESVGVTTCCQLIGWQRRCGACVLNHHRLTFEDPSQSAPIHHHNHIYISFIKIYINWPVHWLPGLSILW